MACRHTQQCDKPCCSSSLWSALAQMALAAQTQLQAPAQHSWAPQSLCCPRLSAGETQSSPGLFVTGDWIFKWNIWRWDVFSWEVSAAGVLGYTPCKHWCQQPPQKSWQISKSTQSLRLSYLLLKALSVLPVLLGLMESSVQSVPYLLEALGSVLWKLLESSINNYYNPPRAKLLGNAAQLLLPKEEASKGKFSSLPTSPDAMVITLHTAPGGWPWQNPLTMCSIGWA